MNVLPYGGDLQAAMRAQDRDAIKAIMGAKARARQIAAAGAVAEEEKKEEAAEEKREEEEEEKQRGQQGEQGEQEVCTKRMRIVELIRGTSASWADQAAMWSGDAHAHAYPHGFRQAQGGVQRLQ